MQPAAHGGAVCIDKSDAFRLTPGIPLVVAGVNDGVLDHEPIIANPNCSAMQLTCALKPLHDAAGPPASPAGDLPVDVRRRRRGDRAPRAIQPLEGDLMMDWELDGEEFSEEWKLREETRKILGLPELPLHATCVRVPVLVGHAQSVWVQTERLCRPRTRERRSRGSPRPTRGAPDASQGRSRAPTASSSAACAGTRPRSSGLALWVVNDNLRKGAALNAVQIAETLLERRLLAA